MSIKGQRIAAAINWFLMLAVCGLTFGIGTLVAFVLTLCGASGGDVCSVMLACAALGMLIGLRVTRPGFDVAGLV